MPVSTNRANFKRRQRRCSDPDEEDPSNIHHKRYYRVHRDTELAMIGIGLIGMKVRDLGNDQHRQQDQT
jgi:hypothetical protein